MVLPKFVNQPLLIQKNRIKINKICNNYKFTNPSIHGKLMEKLVFEQMNEIREMKPNIFAQLKEKESKSATRQSSIEEGGSASFPRRTGSVPKDFAFTFNNRESASRLLTSVQNASSPARLGTE
jgi:hypothetical protein